MGNKKKEKRYSRRGSTNASKVKVSGHQGTCPRHPMFFLNHVIALMSLAILIGSAIALRWVISNASQYPQTIFLSILNMTTNTPDQLERALLKKGIGLNTKVYFSQYLANGGPMIPTAFYGFCSRVTCEALINEHKRQQLEELHGILALESWLVFSRNTTSNPSWYPAVLKKLCEIVIPSRKHRDSHPLSADQLQSQITKEIGADFVETIIKWPLWPIFLEKQLPNILQAIGKMSREGRINPWDALKTIDLMHSKDIKKIDNDISYLPAHFNALKKLTHNGSVVVIAGKNIPQRIIDSYRASCQDDSRCVPL